MSVLNEGFTPCRDHLVATDPAPFIAAAERLEKGCSVIEALRELSSQHRTTLFHVESRPPEPMLLDAGRRSSAHILRACAKRIGDAA